MHARNRREERRRREARRRKDEAAAAFAKGKLARAAELYAQLASEYPEDPQILVRLGEVQRRRGREAEAITAFLRAGGKLAHDGHLLRAIAAYRLVLEIAPNHEGAHALLADLHERRLGRRTSARRERAAAPAPSQHRQREGRDAIPGEAAAIARIALAREAFPAPAANRTPAPRPAAPPPPPPPVPVVRFSPPAPPPDPVRLEELLDAFEIDEETPGPTETPLPSIPLFADLEPEAFQRLVAGSRRLVLGPGERAVTQGEPGDSFFVVVRGLLEVIRESGGITERLASVEEGAFFGEMALLAGTPRSATVWAVEESELLQFTARDLRRLVEDHPSVATALRRFYRQRLLSNVLATSPIFRRFDRATSASLIGRFRTREVAAGERLVDEGRPVDGLFVVLHGSFEVTRRGPDGIVHVASLGEGELFGEMSLLHGGPAGATCTARTRGMVLRLPRESFEAVVRGHPGLRDFLEDLDRERRAAS